LPFTLAGADVVLATKSIFASGLVASALAMYLFARLHLQQWPAVVAATVYAYLPYHLADLYVRGALAEFLGFVWFPLVLWALHRLVENPGGRRLFWLASASMLLVALVATHSLSALIFAPVVLGYVLILLMRGPNLSALTRVALSLSLALAVSAFYWLPVLVEAQYVGLGHGTSQGYQDHLRALRDLCSFGLAYPYSSDPSAARVFPLGLVQIVVIASAVVLVVHSTQRRWVTSFFLAVALVSAFVLSTASLPVWRALERGLAFLQYPWRFQALTALATAFLAGALVEGVTKPSSIGRAVLCIAVLFTTGVWALWRLPVTPITPGLSVEAMWQMDRDHGQVGATWTGEYLPIWVKEQRWAISHPVPQPATGSVSLPSGQVRLDGVGYTCYDLELDSDRSTTLILHQFHFPGWEAVGKAGQAGPYHSAPAGVLGLAAFDLPADVGPLRLQLGHTPAQFWGTLTSLIVCLVIAAALIMQPLRAKDGAVWGSMLLAFCYLLLAAVLLSSLLLPSGLIRPAIPVNANLEDSVELLAFTTSQTSYQPGDLMEVTLYWRALRDLDGVLKTFVHVTDAALAHQPAQHDSDPGGGFTPITRWLPGEVVPDTHQLALPSGLAPGRYLLWAGMYEHETVRNLAVLSADVPEADGRLLLGEVEVTAP
jgi:hypothetical protein